MALSCVAIFKQQLSPLSVGSPFYSPPLPPSFRNPDPATAASPYPRFTGQSSWSDSEYIAAPDNEVVQFEPADFWSGKHRMRRADENLITSCPGLDGDAVYIDFLENQNFSLDTLSKDLTPGQLRNLTLFNSRNQKLLNRTALYAEIGIRTYAYLHFQRFGFFG